jgi:hypothetical protein
MKKKYLVELSEQEREYLHKLISSGTAPARKLNRARILLKAEVVGKHSEAQALSDRQIARMLADLHCHSPKGARTLLGGRTLQGALERSKPNRLYKRSLWRGVPKRT